MTPADASYFFKLGFLMACADRGLGGDEAERLAERMLVKRAGPLRWIGGQIARLPAYAIGGVGAAVAQAGRGIGSIVPAVVGQDKTPMTPDVHRMKALTEEIKRRRARLQATPGLFA